MKNLTIILLGTFLTFGSFAQKTPNYGPDKDKCLEKISLYSGYLKQKMYKDAYRFWREAVAVCPEYKTNLYTNGVYILKKLRKEKGISKEQKKIYTDSILTVYQAGIKIFGGTPEILERYGADLIVYGRDYSNGVKNLKEAIDGLRHEIRYTTVIYYAQALAKLERKKEVDCERLINEYEILTGFVDQNKDNKKFKVEKAQTAIDKYLGPCLTCDKLVPLMEVKMEKALTDEKLRAKILKQLNKRKCTNNNVFKKLTFVEIEHKPSISGYEGGAIIMSNDGKATEALKYIDKAIALADNNTEKERLLMKAIAIAKKGRKGTSGYMKKALDVNPKNGKIYLMKAHNAARSGCGNSNFERSTKYWVAYDIAAKAKSLDPSVSSEAVSLMSSYKSRFPEKGEIFAQGLKVGSSYKTCLGVSSTIRAK